MIEPVYRHFIIPGFESVVKRRSTFKHWRMLERTQWWSAAKLEAWQLHRLRELLPVVEKTSPYYRSLWSKHGLEASHLQSLNDFQRWPLTSRDSMRQQMPSIRSTDRSLKSVSKSTGGSSGVPLRFTIDHSANDRRVAASFRGYAWAGAGPGSRQTYLWGVNLGNSTLWKRCKEYFYSRSLYRRDFLSSFELADTTVEKFVARLNRYRPKALVAYVNPLYTLARMIEARGLETHRPASIVVGAEKIHGFQRTVIERVLSAPVYETYGSREFTLIGSQCRQRDGLHLSAENLLVEILDDYGQPVSPGNEGQIVITDLFNISTPFIRYPIGDRGIASRNPCPCGRGLPILREVTGRQLDIIVTADGRHLAGEFFPHLMKDIDAIQRFQVTQSQTDLIELTLVVNSRWTDQTRESLHLRVQQAIGSSTRLRIREVDHIPLTAAGKLQVVKGLKNHVKRSA